MQTTGIHRSGQLHQEPLQDRLTVESEAEKTWTCKFVCAIDLIVISPHKCYNLSKYTHFCKSGPAMKSMLFIGSLLTLCFCKNQPVSQELTLAAAGFEVNSDILEEFTIPLDDVSGLALRPGATGDDLELLAISDKSFSLAVAPIASPLKRMDFELLNLTGSGLDFFREHSRSNWEAVASDSTGNIFLLEEDPGAVYVLNRALTQGLNRIRFRIPDHGSIRELWQRDSNGRGEGLLLLRNGNILVVKEKDPTVLIEFGPRGALPSGMSVGNAGSESVGLDGVFPLPAERDVDFFPLKVWSFAKFPPNGDLSEIALGPDSSLLLLSDELRSIYAVPDLSQFQLDSLDVKEETILPKALSKPEGLVVTPRWQVLIAVDDNPSKKKPKRQPNLFLLNRR
jgi:hypothetical protein